MDSTHRNTGEAAIATIAYADIFDYPLTREELHRWMIGNTSGSIPTKQVDNKSGYYYLKRRSALVALRAERRRWQREKWEIAERAAHWLSKIPGVELIGVTGGLAMNNARREDDIDLFFIVSDGALWISRLLATVCMDALGMRRRPQDVHVRNKVCLNMFVTRRGMGLTSRERDCFAAHEVLQMKPLWEKEGTHQRFLKSNVWVRNFLPNAWKEIYRGAPKRRGGGTLLRILEPLAKAVQLWYMRRHRTNEVITDTELRFHPKDARVWIKKKLSLRLRRLNIPLDNIFYGR